MTEKLPLEVTNDVLANADLFIGVDQLVHEREWKLAQKNRLQRYTKLLAQDGAKALREENPYPHGCPLRTYAKALKTYLVVRSIDIP